MLSWFKRVNPTGRIHLFYAFRFSICLTAFMSLGDKRSVSGKSSTNTSSISKRLAPTLMGGSATSKYSWYSLAANVADISTSRIWGLVWISRRHSRHKMSGPQHKQIHVSVFEKRRAETSTVPAPSTCSTNLYQPTAHGFHQWLSDSLSWSFEGDLRGAGQGILKMKKQVRLCQVFQERTPNDIAYP